MFLKFLPKALSPFKFQTRPLSSNNLNKAPKTHLGRGFSGPIGTIVPVDRRKIKNSSLSSHEPTSPKISCMGQINHKWRISKQKRVSLSVEAKKTEKSSIIRNVFRFGKGDDRKFEGTDDYRGSNLGQMKKFASGSDSFANFAVQIAPVESDGDGEDEVTIPLSANMVIGGGVVLMPRKEINLWKRRTMAQPKPLKLNTML
ncbi:hypothetical protein LguiA_003614 [Lonicera macranthoides]